MLSLYPTATDSLDTITTAMAESIALNGHFQGNDSDNERTTTDHLSECVAFNDALPFGRRDEVFTAILTAAGVEVPSDSSDLLHAAVSWNDSTPTDKVLDTLRSIG